MSTKEEKLQQSLLQQMKQVKVINIALQIKCILYESIAHKGLIGRKLFNTLPNKLWLNDSNITCFMKIILKISLEWIFICISEICTI